MRTFSSSVVVRTGYVSLSKNIKLSLLETSVISPMRNPSSRPCFTHVLTTHLPSAVFSAALTSPRLSARFSSSKTRMSALENLPGGRAANVSICSRNGMSFLQQADFDQDLTHECACLLLHRDERQSQVFFEQTHHLHRRFHWSRTRLDKVSFHQRQQTIVERACFVPLSGEREIVELRHERRSFVRCD